MAKQLIIFRHAEAESGGSFSGDHSRILSSQGELSAALMGHALAKTGESPEYAVSSSAVRAQSTLEIANREGGWDCVLDNTDTLYDTSIEQSLKFIQSMPAEYNRTMIVGHEPTWSALTSQLVGGGAFRFRTAAMACVEFNVHEWSDIEFGSGSICWFIHPALFKN